MLVVRDYFAINLDNCKDFFCNANNNRIIFCMDILDEEGDVRHLNQFQYSTKQEMFEDFNKIVRFYAEREKVCLLSNYFNFKEEDQI